MKVGNGNVVVIAHNLKDQALVSWYLQSDTNGKFRALPGESGIIERKLFKFDNPGQLVLDENTMLYTQVRKNSIENPEVRKTNIFKFDMAKLVQNLKDRKGANDFLLSNRNGQINITSSIASNPGEINFLQYVRRTEGDDQIAFLAKKQSSNTQELHLASLAKKEPQSNFTICECEDPIEQLYVKDNGQGGFIVTAISEESIITFNRESSGKSSEAKIIPTSSIKALSDFVNIINGRLTPNIISSSTVAPITITKTVVTSKEGSTAAITDIKITDALKTTKLTTEAVAPTSTISKPLTESTTRASTVTVEPTTEASTTAAPTSTTSEPSTIQTSTVKVEPTTVAKTTTTPQTTTVATTSTSVPIVTSGTGASTVKSTAATIASTSEARSTTMSKPLTELTTKIGTTSMSSEPTTVAETIATSKSTMITTMPTNAPTANSETTTQTVSTMSSIGTKVTTPLFITTLLPQTTTPSPQPVHLAIGSNRAGMIGGSLVGAIGVAGIIGFIAYKCIKKYHGYYNTTHMLELADLESHSNGSDEEIFIASNRMSHISVQTMD